ncbi:MAG: hypothetical protein RR891_08125 [Clostridium sp.]|uniref:hypothetical protein n=1 Tax=Clostridium sp. TaxID=1506 RepID=UPI0030303A2C
MKRFFFVSVILITLLLTGCSLSDNTNENMKNNTVIESENSSTNVSKELDKNLTIDAEAKVPDAENYNVLNVKYKEYNSEQVCDLLLKDDIIDTRNEYGTGSDKSIIIETKNNKVLSISKESLYFSLKDNGYSRLRFELDQFLFDDMKHKFPKDELISLNKKESIDKVRQIAKALNLHIDDEPIVYSMDIDSLKAAENNFMTDEEAAEWEAMKPGTGKRNWTEDEEGYLIVFKSSSNNIPIYSRDLVLSSDNSHLNRSELNAVVTKNGIASFEVSSMYDLVSIDTENLSCIDYSQALEVVKNKYKNIIITDPIKITNINLEYIPRLKDKKLGEFKLTPAWVFTTEEENEVIDSITNNKKIQKSTKAILVDAITGKEIK